MLNWNVELQNIFATKINSAFNALEEDIDVVETDINADINEVYQKLQESLEGMISSVPWGLRCSPLTAFCSMRSRPRR